MKAGEVFLAVFLVAAAAAADDLFTTSDQCLACHNAIVTAKGHDISIGSDWRSSMMANAARDPYWQAAVRREVLEHPESAAAIEAECSKCHMPMARIEAVAGGGTGRVFAHLPVNPAAARPDLLAADGVSCSVCHQIEPDHLGDPRSFSGGFTVDTKRSARAVYGPFDIDRGRTRVMHSASLFSPKRATHIRTSEACATCHTLHTHSLGRGGKVVGRLPEQVPYLEWKASAFGGSVDCDVCHMPLAEGDAPITSVVAQSRPDVNRHVFRGGNFLVARMLRQFGKELGVVAPAEELRVSAERTIEHLGRESATVALSGVALRDGVVTGSVTVQNMAGHKLPTAYPSRRVWLHLVVRDGAGRVRFESGALRGDGAIEGNDNDRDPARYEPHRTRIDGPDQVQIWEAILTDDTGRVTTGLLTGTRYAKDNRLLPDGFARSAASDDVAVRGEATKDDDFTGGSDLVSFAMAVGEASEVTVEAELLYQPIGYRWAENLRAFQSMETARFVRYFEALAKESAVVLARNSITVSR